MSREAIDRIRQRIDAAWLRSDAEGITRDLAEDAVLLPPNAPRQMGRPQITEFLRELFRHYTMTHLAMPERELEISGDTGVERTLYQWTLTPKHGGEAIHDQANWIGIWHQRDGKWVEVCGIWNSTLPAASAPPMEGAEAAASN